jgi:hypothetical protein
MSGLSTAARIARALQLLAVYNSLPGSERANIDIVIPGDPFQFPPVKQKPLFYQLFLKKNSPAKYREHKARLNTNELKGLKFWEEFEHCVVLQKCHRMDAGPAVADWGRRQELLVRRGGGAGRSCGSWACRLPLVSVVSVYGQIGRTRCSNFRLPYAPLNWLRRVSWSLICSDMRTRGTMVGC